MLFSASPILAAIMNAQEHQENTFHIAEKTSNNQQYSGETSNVAESDDPPTTVVYSITNINEIYENWGKKDHHNVLAMHPRETITRWIIVEVTRAETEKNIQSKTITNFAQFFRSSHASNFLHEKWIWIRSSKLIDDYPGRGQWSEGLMLFVT